MSSQLTKYSKLKYIKTLGIVNNNPIGRGFASPVDLAFNSDAKRIYVLNRGVPYYHRVGVFTFDDEYLYEFSSFGDAPGQLKQPTGIAVDKSNRVYVTDEFHNKVIVFDEEGNFIQDWGEAGPDVDQLNSPAAIDIDQNDNIYITCQDSHRVQIFTTEGRFVKGFGSFGHGDGQFNMPWGVDKAPDGHIFVADWRNDRIQKFSPDGDFVGSFGSSGSGDGEFDRPSNVEVDSEGLIYVADWNNQRVQVFDSRFNHVETLLGEATLSSWAKEYYSANPEEMATREISDLRPRNLPEHMDTAYLASSQIEPHFWGPISVNLDLEGRLFVAETSRHRFQIYEK